jgi:hypothetical protein
VAEREAGPGRFREFIQCDADTVGSARPEADAEVIAMAAEGLEAAGLARGQFVLKINNRKLLNGLMDRADVADPGSAWRCCARWTSWTGWGRRACACCWARGGWTKAAPSPRGRG